MTENKIISPTELWLVPVLLLCFAFFSLPYAYYQLLRWVVCGCTAYIAFQNHQNKGKHWVTFPFIGFAIIYNPIAPIYLSNDVWSIINIITAIAFICAWLSFKRNKER